MKKLAMFFALLLLAPVGAVAGTAFPYAVDSDEALRAKCNNFPQAIRNDKDWPFKTDDEAREGCLCLVEIAIERMHREPALRHDAEKNIDQLMRVEDLNVCIEQPRAPKAQPTKPKSRPKKRFKQLQTQTVRARNRGRRAVEENMHWNDRHGAAVSEVTPSKPRLPSSCA